ncbi:MAG: class I SAM-dependent methyltransferase, partial [Calditrichaeota bacterium]
IPVLIDEKCSIFSIEDIIQNKECCSNKSFKNRFKRSVKKLLPELTLNPISKRNYIKFEREILSNKSEAIVLVLGGGVIGKGMEHILANPRLTFIETDVYFGPRTNLICDAHVLPFKDSSLDAVIIQAVLEHVVDPYRCVDEIFRVLNEDGVIYSETPFIQQVHLGAFDFTRFTHLGHRRLFRWFSEIDSGPACGPAMALTWSYKYFLSSFSSSRLISKILGFFAVLTSFWIIFLDYYLIKKPGSYDAASSYYFLGRKNKVSISDREIIKAYKGLI